MESQKDRRMNGDRDRNAKREKRREREAETDRARGAGTQRQEQKDQCRTPTGRRAQGKTANIWEGGRDGRRESEMWDTKDQGKQAARQAPGGSNGGRGREAWASREVGLEVRWDGACSGRPHAHSLQEDEGAVGAVTPLLLLLLTAAPQHRLPVWG